jgi:hypothetical protein
MLQALAIAANCAKHRFSILSARRLHPHPRTFTVNIRNVGRPRILRASSDVEGETQEFRYWNQERFFSFIRPPIVN